MHEWKSISNLEYFAKDRLEELDEWQLFREAFRADAARPM